MLCLDDYDWVKMFQAQNPSELSDRKMTSGFLNKNQLLVGFLNQTHKHIMFVFSVWTLLLAISIDSRDSPKVPLSRCLKLKNFDRFYKGGISPHQLIHVFVELPSRELTHISYQTGKGKSSTQKCRLGGDMWSFPGGYTHTTNITSWL